MKSLGAYLSGYSVVRKGFGFLVLLIGIAIIIFSIWFSIWFMLVGGIVDIVNQIKATQTDAQVIAVAIVKVLFFELPFAVGFFGGGTVVGWGGWIAFSKKPSGRYNFNSIIRR